MIINILLFIWFLFWLIGVIVRLFTKKGKSSKQIFADAYAVRRKYERLYDEKYGR